MITFEHEKFLKIFKDISSVKVNCTRSSSIHRLPNPIVNSACLFSSSRNLFLLEASNRAKGASKENKSRDICCWHNKTGILKSSSQATP